MKVINNTKPVGRKQVALGDVVKVDDHLGNYYIVCREDRNLLNAYSLIDGNRQTDEPVRFTCDKIDEALDRLFHGEEWEKVEAECHITE